MVIERLLSLAAEVYCHCILNRGSCGYHLWLLHGVHWSGCHIPAADAVADAVACLSGRVLRSSL